MANQLRLKEPKTAGSHRTIRVAKRTVAALRNHRDRMKAEGRDVSTGVVFPAPEGGFLRQSNFLRGVFRPILKAAGLPTIRMYDLRHTAATLLLLRGVNLKAVSHRLGHDDVETTLRHYAKVLPDMEQQAADAVDGLFGNVSPPIVPLDQFSGFRGPRSDSARSGGGLRTSAKYPGQESNL